MQGQQKNRGEHDKKFSLLHGIARGLVTKVSDIS